MRTWEEAWGEALYADGGFYRRGGGPAGHFETASHGRVGRALARTLVGLAREVGATAVVDVGAGRGELLGALRSVGWGGPLAGVDVVDRPAGLPDGVGWARSPGGGHLPGRDAVTTALGADLGTALVVAHEWLDVVPCPVAEVGPDGVLREVLVDGAGHETLGPPLDGRTLAWADRWWPERSPGDGVEVGAPRDGAWAGLLDRWRPRAAVAIDYGHTLEARPPGGTFAAYRDGRRCEPSPDGSCDLTAHVAVDSLRHDLVLTGAEAVGRWGPPTTLPDDALSRTDPAAYLEALADAGAARALADGPYGTFAWVLAGRPVSSA